MPVQPAPDLVANGNDRASGGGLGAYYAPGWRAHRIRELLAQSPERAADADAMAAIHRDVWLGPARAAQDLIRGVPAEGPAAVIKEQLLGWDGRMDADSRPALLYAAWRSALVDWICRQPPLDRLLDPDPLPEVYASWMNPRNRIGVSFDAICRNADSLGLDLRPGVRTALEQVAADSPGGSWGDAHRLAPLHGLTGLADQHVPPLPDPRLAGDGNCVRSTHTAPGITHRCSMASMARYVWDRADRSASRWVVPFGASGRPGDPHHVDQTGAWVAGELLPIVTDWERLTPEPE
jgi:penicillin amidase